MYKWEIKEMLAEGKHPEMKDGEMFLTNVIQETFEEIDWKTKRKGKIAYDKNGEEIKSVNKLFPVFVQKKEFDEGIYGEIRNKTKE